MKKSILSAAVAAIATLGVAPAAHADTPPPVVVTDTAPATAVSGTQVVFDVTVNQPGYAPTNGSQKTQYLSRGQFKADNNYTVIPMTVTVVDGVTHWLFTYTTQRTGVIYFSVTVPVSNARIPATVTGSAAITVA